MINVTSRDSFFRQRAQPVTYPQAGKVGGLCAEGNDFWVQPTGRHCMIQGPTLPGALALWVARLTLQELDMSSALAAFQRFRDGHRAYVDVFFSAFSA